MMSSSPSSLVRRGALALGAVILVSAGAIYLSGDDSAAAPRAELVSVSQGTVTASVSAAGNTVDNGMHDLTFSSQGAVEKIYVSVGDKVSKGDVLARIDDTIARENYTAAKAALAAAEESLDNVGSTSTTTSGNFAQGSGSGSGGATGGSGSGGSGTGGSGTSAGCPSSGTAKPSASPAATGKPGQAPQGSSDGGSSPVEPALEGGGAQAARASSTRPPDAGKPSTGGSERDVSVTLDPNGPDDSKEPEPKPSPSPRPSSTPTCANQGGQGSANQQPNGQGAQGVQARQGGGAVQQGGGQGARAMTEAEAESAVSQATTDLAEAKEVLRGVTIKAPADGTVLSIAGTLDTNYTGGTFITLGDLDNLQVQALFPQSDIGYLKLGQTATITINSTDSYEGTVAHIDPTATTSGQLVRYGVTITFKDQPKGLLLGQSATVQVTTAESEDTLYIPARALHTSATGTTTVTTPSGEKTIKTGVRSDLYIEVTEGLTTTDQITLPATSATEFPDEGFPGL